MQDAEQQQAPQTLPQPASPADASQSVAVAAPDSSQPSSTQPATSAAVPEGGAPRQNEGQRHKRPPRPDNKSKNFQRRNKPQHGSHGGNGNGDRGFDRHGDNDEGPEEVESAEPMVVVPLDPAKPGASRSGQTWTAVERQQVSNAFREGMPIDQISIASGRSDFAVACHLEYAGLLSRGEALQYAKKMPGN